MAARRGWWVGTVVDGGAPHLTVLGTTQCFSATEVFQEVMDFARMQDELAIRILTAIFKASQGASNASFQTHAGD